MNIKSFAITLGTLLVLTLAPLAADQSQVIAGQDLELEGVIVERSQEGFLLRTHGDREYWISLSADTKIEEKKSNIFRRAKKYTTEELLLGLVVQVEGVGDQQGRLVAEEVEFTQDDLKTARTISSRVTPVESRLEQAEGELTAAKGEIEELDSAFRVVREEAQQAQETADQADERAIEALDGVDRTNERIEAFDRFQEAGQVTVNFGFDSAEISTEAARQLDEIAGLISTQPGYLLEVRGFASSDGNDEYNRRLSQQRAEAVVRYLVERHGIPMRRIVMPFGFGEMNPVADNSDRSGRQENRRVEIRVLVNEALAEAG